MITSPVRGIEILAVKKAADRRSLTSSDLFNFSGARNKYSIDRDTISK